MGSNFDSRTIAPSLKIAFTVFGGIIHVKVYKVYRGPPTVHPQGILLTQFYPQSQTPDIRNQAAPSPRRTKMFSKIMVVFALAAVAAANPVPQILPTSLPVSIPALPTSISLSLPLAIPTAVGDLLR